jgi:hypothetical protein
MEWNWSFSGESLLVVKVGKKRKNWKMSGKSLQKNNPIKGKSEWETAKHNKTTFTYDLFDFSSSFPFAAASSCTDRHYVEWHIHSMKQANFKLTQNEKNGID